MLHAIQYIQCTIHCTLYSIAYILHHIRYTTACLYTRDYTLHIVYCFLYMPCQTLRMSLSELMAMTMEMAKVWGCCCFCWCGDVEDVDGHDDERMMMLMMMMMMMEKISVRMWGFPFLASWMNSIFWKYNQNYSKP